MAGGGAASAFEDDAAQGSLLARFRFDRPAIRSSSSPVAWLDWKSSKRRGGSLLVLFADDEWGEEEGKLIIRFGTLKKILNALEICYCVFRKCDSMSTIASSRPHTVRDNLESNSPSVMNDEDQFKLQSVALQEPV